MGESEIALTLFSFFLFIVYVRKIQFHSLIAKKIISKLSKDTCGQLVSLTIKTTINHSKNCPWLASYKIIVTIIFKINSKLDILYFLSFFSFSWKGLLSIFHQPYHMITLINYQDSVLCFGWWRFMTK